MSTFTDLYLRNLPPRPERYDVREGNGFLVRVFPSGEKSFQLVYDYAGRRRRMTLGAYAPPAYTLKQARTDLAVARGELARGIDPATRRADAIKAVKRTQEEERRKASVEKMVEEYIEHYAKPRKRSWREDQRILAVDVVPAWKGRKAADITRRDVAELLDGIKARVLKLGRSNGTQVNKVLVVVRKMFNVARDRGMVEDNPCLGMSKPVKETARARVLSDTEIRAIWEGLPTAPVSTDIADLLRLMLLTGQRRGEILQMQWDGLDLGALVWNLPAEITKNQRAHAVPITPMVLEIIERRYGLRTSDSLVFPGASIAEKPILGPSVDHAVRRWLDPAWAKDKALAMPPWTPHDLRRTVETRLAALGISDTVRKKLLNHLRDRITEVYDRHGYDSEKRAALVQWETELRRILGQNVAPLRRARRG